MMRSQRKALPLLALLGFEAVAVVGLQALGSNHAMQIPWGNLTNWLNTSNIEDIAPPVVRLAALVFAYWMFATTALCVIASISRIPGAIRATSVFALPSVRRMVNGAMVASIATTTMLGGGATAAFADDASTSTSIPAATDITSSISANINDNSVATPLFVSGDAALTATPNSDGSVSVSADDGTTTTTSSTEAPTTTSTTAAPTTTTAAPTTTTAAPTTTTAAPETTTTISPSLSDQWVPTPGVGAPMATTSTTLGTTTTVAQGPSDSAVNTPSMTDNSTTATTDDSSAPAASDAGTQVLAESDHRVTAGENLWTISRDALASSTGQPASSISESQIRDYWLKVIDANKDNLRSHDPHWIFPGEVVTLPSAT